MWNVTVAAVFWINDSKDGCVTPKYSTGAAASRVMVKFLLRTRQAAY